jgi:hypothetical protein
MRVYNLDALHQDIRSKFRTSASELSSRFTAWLAVSLSKEMVKNPMPGFFHPIQVKNPPSMIEGLNLKPSLVAKVPRFGDQKLSVQSEFDVKDATAGILQWYMPSETSLDIYQPRVIRVRDYFYSAVLNQEGVDTRRISFADSERSAAEWHAEQVRQAQRRAREFEEQRKNQTREVREPEVGLDWIKVGNSFTGPDGKQFTVYRMMTPNALNYESMQMQHCVHSYADRLQDKELVLCTVRESSSTDKVIATFELCLEPILKSVTIVQIRGKLNSNPDEKIKGIVTAIQQKIQGTNWFSREVSGSGLEFGANPGEMSFAVRIPSTARN